MKVSLVSLCIIGYYWGGDRNVVLFFLFLDFELAIHILHIRFLNSSKILHLALGQPKAIICSVLNYSCGLLLYLTKLMHNLSPALVYLIC